MIITNKIAQLIVRLASIPTPGTDAVTVWPFIFCKPEYKYDKKLIAHEREHLKQWIRYGIIGFLPVYLYQYFKFGYWDAPLEIEARKAANLTDEK